ncbi:urea transporter 2 isoform X2 [Monomorium pharaonis]|uniref:urea transporter 2 isoform X2 n=1 Tax=Monomorium pharaonis TaxID=307658 RepID=UPI00102E13B8|nr:urea transporter 2 isoform X2 [Monomorium pharaonis]
MISTKELPVELRQEKTWVAFVGDFAILKEFFAHKRRRLWHAVQLLDAFLRGFGQTVFANNPLSGLLIIVTLAAVTPGTLALSAATAGLGLLLSVLIREPDEIIENGISTFNPVLVGAISYILIPQIYGSFDAFSFLLVFLATIFSVYLSRSLRSDKFPCIAWPFNLVEFALIFALSTQNGADMVAKSVDPVFEMHNATSETTTTTMMTTTDDAGLLHEQNASSAYIDWGMAQLPVLTLPYVTATSLFLKLSEGKEDPTFPSPVSITFPEKERHRYLARRAAFREEVAAEELQLVTGNERKPTSSDN